MTNASPSRPRPRPRPQHEPEPSTGPSAEVERPAEGAPAKRRLRLTRWGLLVTVLVLAVAAGAWFVYHYAAEPESRGITPAVAADGTYRVGTIPAGQDAARVLARELPGVLAYDYRSLDKGRDAAAKLMTPGFRSTYVSTFDKAVRPTAVAQKAVTRALVRAVGVTNVAGPDKVTCLVFVDQLLVPSSSAKQAAKISQNRVSVTMERVGGTWLIGGLTPF